MLFIVIVYFVTAFVSVNGHGSSNNSYEEILAALQQLQQTNLEYGGRIHQLEEQRQSDAEKMAQLKSEIDQLRTGCAQASEVVAFSAYANEEIEYTTNQVIGFPVVVSNIGSAYNSDTGRFTCPVKGLYMFSNSCLTNSDNRAELVIAKNGNALVSTVSETNNDAMSTVVVFDECDQGEYFEVRCGPSFSECQCDGDDYLGAVTFSGMLVGLIV